MSIAETNGGSRCLSLAMTRIQSFILAPIVLGIVVSALVVIDIVRQNPVIPPQISNLGYERIMPKPKKHNPLNDFVTLPHVCDRYQNH